MKFRASLLWTTSIAAAMTLSLSPVIAQTAINIGNKLSPNPLQISGAKSGGNVNSSGCGWISSTPQHKLNINSQGIVSLKLTVTEPGNGTPQPYTLMIQNASNPSADTFCAIADPASGIKAEIGGVWNPGTYNVYVGEFDQSSHPYILKIAQ